ncbi:MAG: hypothetical protein WBA00_05680 [Rhodococcus sp. (in: high G+C Gram-positive bacteria)]
MGSPPFDPATVYYTPSGSTLGFGEAATIPDGDVDARSSLS